MHVKELYSILKVIIERRLFESILIEKILHKKMQEHAGMIFFLM